MKGFILNKSSVTELILGLLVGVCAAAVVRVMGFTSDTSLIVGTIHMAFIPLWFSIHRAISLLGAAFRTNIDIGQRLNNLTSR